MGRCCRPEVLARHEVGRRAGHPRRESDSAIIPAARALSFAPGHERLVVRPGLGNERRDSGHVHRIEFDRPVGGKRRFEEGLERRTGLLRMKRSACARTDQPPFRQHSRSVSPRCRRRSRSHGRSSERGCGGGRRPLVALASGGGLSGEKPQGSQLISSPRDARARSSARARGRSADGRPRGP